MSMFPRKLQRLVTGLETSSLPDTISVHRKPAGEDAQTILEQQRQDAQAKAVKAARKNPVFLEHLPGEVRAESGGAVGLKVRESMRGGEKVGGVAPYVSRVPEGRDSLPDLSIARGTQEEASSALSLYRDLEQKVVAAEKRVELEHGPATHPVDYANWKAWSRDRGYTKQEISDFGKWIDLNERLGIKEPDEVPSTDHPFGMSDQGVVEHALAGDVGKYVYHRTFADILPAIREKGLLPHLATGAKEVNGVHFTSNPLTASHLAGKYRFARRDGMYLRVKKAGHPSGGSSPQGVR